jgi:hypothetical protein
MDANFGFSQDVSCNIDYFDYFVWAIFCTYDKNYLTVIIWFLGVRQKLALCELSVMSSKLIKTSGTKISPFFEANFCARERKS